MTTTAIPSPFARSVRQALAEYLAPRLNCESTVKAVARAWPHRLSGSPSTPLWQSQKKGPLTTSAMRQMIDVLVRDTAACGLVPAQISAHTLRHTFARNYLAEHPGGIVGLASLLGHTSLSIVNPRSNNFRSASSSFLKTLIPVNVRRAPSE
jgi:site-specific recombinase XerD